jgi:hypothetical protein
MKSSKVIRKRSLHELRILPVGIQTKSGATTSNNLPARVRTTTCFNPNSEIETGNLPQGLGAETNRKNRGIPEVVCRDFFNSFMPKRLRQIAGFNFGFRA